MASIRFVVFDCNSNHHSVLRVPQNGLSYYPLELTRGLVKRDSVPVCCHFFIPLPSLRGDRPFVDWNVLRDSRRSKSLSRLICIDASARTHMSDRRYGSLSHT